MMPYDSPCISRSRLRNLRMPPTRRSACVGAENTYTSAAGRWAGSASSVNNTNTSEPASFNAEAR